MAFTSLLPPTSKAPRSQVHHTTQVQQLIFLLKNSLSISSWLLLGGSLGGLLSFFVNPLYILSPLVLILASRFTYALLVTFHILPNPYLVDSILQRTSAQVPDKNGDFSDTGAAEKVVCFHLGAKYNHPLGVFAPNGKELGDRFDGLVRELDKSHGSKGYLGGTGMFAVDTKGALEFSFISYWRSIEAIHDFAYGPTHRAAWDWWNNLSEEGSRHLGINHEIFSAEPGQWEAIYLNHQPTMLGATTFLKKGDKMIGGVVEDKFINALIDASKGTLRSSAGRLGRNSDQLYEKYGTKPKKPAYET